MLELNTTDDVLLLSESVELECKLAAGKEGDGKLPDDLWKTYSAFANTQGGWVLLGVKEKPVGHFEVRGVADVEKLKTDLFNTLNNRNKVSHNLLTDESVEVVSINGKTILAIHIPAAHRHQKPVYLNGNPMTGNTYRRLYEGDRACDDETVRRMLAEQVEDERDARILPGFTWDDIDPESFRVYRQMLKDAKPGHPFLELEDFELLKKLRGWRRDRQTGEEGLTLAGLLMFGNWDALQEAVPHYFVDYQERPEARTELRWVDRLVPDGSWSGNVFEFYRRVYRKLTDGLKVPFKLAAGQRQDDTPVHEAIREALVNTLVHADYTGRVSILVVKRPDMFGFRNPGDMRIPQDDAIQGGQSDCRNRIMHQMFLMIGLGERAGSGIPKIFSGWDWRHWRRPALYQKIEPPQTLLELRMLELLPEGVLEQLQTMFGERFAGLTKLERLILATAATEQVVTHARMCEITADHGHDVTLSLQQLVKQGFLLPSGHGRGTVYHLPGQQLPTPEEVFGGSTANIEALLLGGIPGKFDDVEDYFETSSEHLALGYEYNEVSSEHLRSDFVHLQASSEHCNEEHDEFGRLISRSLPAPMIHELHRLESGFRQQLESIASIPRTKKRMGTQELRQVILKLCAGHFVTRSCLAQLLNRDADALRQQYLRKMLTEHLLVQAFPQVPTHKMQAYMTRVTSSSDSQHGTPD